MRKIFEFINNKKDWIVETIILSILLIYTLFGTLLLGINGFIRSIYNSGLLILGIVSVVGVLGTIVKNYVNKQDTWKSDFKMFGIIFFIVLVLFVLFPFGYLRVETYKATGIIGVKNPGNPRVYLLGVENFKPQTFSPALSFREASIWESIVGAEYNAQIDVKCNGKTTFEKGIDIKLGGILGESKKQFRTDLYKIQRASKCEMIVSLQQRGEVVDRASFTFNSPGKTVEV